MKTHFAAAIFVFIISLLHPTPVVQATDETIVEKAIGQDVVFAVVSKIQNSFIFFEDYDFLKRIAWVESSFGESANTFPPDYFGGIWQLPERLYDITKDTLTYPALSSLHEGIATSYSIDWPSTTWSDLLKPLYSGLAARLYLSTLTTPIPQTLTGQAALWLKDYSNTDGDTEADFIEKVTAWENSTVCRGKMDLMVILDESGSIGQANFKLALEFVANLFGSYSLANVREAFITFSSSNRIIFGLDSGLSAEEIESTVLNLNYGEGGTNTNDAIMRGVGLFRSSVERPGVPRIMTLFTDGQSNEGGPVDGGAQAARDNNITVFAIGIAEYYKPELDIIAGGDPSKVFTLDDFQALTEFFHRLNSETCEIPQKPGLNETIEEEIELNEKRIYYFDVPPNGVTVYLLVDQGEVVSYYSHSFSDPSSALNDGVIVQGSNYVYPETETLWVSVTGLKDKNKYAILVIASLDPPPTTTTSTTTTTTEAPPSTTTTTEDPTDPPITTEDPTDAPITTVETDAPSTTTPTSTTTPSWGNGGRCNQAGVRPHPDDCQKYIVCEPNDVGDLWATIYTCSDDDVFCLETGQCASPSVCPCDRDSLSNLWY